MKYQQKVCTVQALQEMLTDLYPGLVTAKLLVNPDMITSNADLSSLSGTERNNYMCFKALFTKEVDAIVNS